jgi:hypothetical protein
LLRLLATQAAKSTIEDGIFAQTETEEGAISIPTAGFSGRAGVSMRYASCEQMNMSRHRHG